MRSGRQIVAECGLVGITRSDPQTDMDIWFSKTLGDGMTASGPSGEIEKAFVPLFLAMGSPADMAVFTRFDSEGRLQCEVTAFFSPAAGEVAKRFDAQPCVKPPRDGLILLTGDGRCWAALFPAEAGRNDG